MEKWITTWIEDKLNNSPNQQIKFDSKYSECEYLGRDMVGHLGREVEGAGEGRVDGRTQEQ